jgi:Flp pilus assembly pilin Flp
MRQSHGIGVLEFALIIGLIALVVIAVLVLIGPSVGSIHHTVQPNP